MYICIKKAKSDFFRDFTSQEDQTFQYFVSAGNLFDETYTECLFSLLFGASLGGQNLFFIECFVYC